MNKIAVITCVTDNYDYIGHHVGYKSEVDYLFFTDGTSEPKDKTNWETILLPEMDLDSRRKAKIPKLNPHMIPRLRDYEYVIWIDGSMQIRSKTFIEEFLHHMTDRGLVLSPHFDDRDCGYSEATINFPGQPVKEQAEFYRSEGFPEHFGLYECGIQARRMDTPGLQEFGECWFEQVLNWSSRDQISCGYALWKTGFTPDVLPENFRSIGWVHVNAHRSRKRKQDG